MNLQDMAIKESGNGEQLSTNIDMDGGANAKMKRVVVPPMGDMVMVDANEGVDDTIEFVVQV